MDLHFTDRRNGVPDAKPMRAMALLHANPRRWTRDEYYRMLKVGLLHEEDKVELLDGQIVEKMSRGPRHDHALTLATEVLLRLFSGTHYLRPQCAVDLSLYSQPEPDIALIRREDLSIKAHPRTADLFIEIADSSLRLDRKDKARIYAQAGVQDYWILDVVNCRMEVLRDPGPEGYRSRVFYSPDESVAPLFAPDHHIRVADLL